MTLKTPCPDCDGGLITEPNTGNVDDCLSCGGSGTAPAVTDAQVEAAIRALGHDRWTDHFATRMRVALTAAARAREENHDG